MAEGSTTNPFKLGPFQNLKTVHWAGSSGILYGLLTYTLSAAGSVPSIPSAAISASPFGDDPWSILAGSAQLREDFDDTPPAIVNPVTGAMLQAYAIWSPHARYDNIDSGDSSDSFFTYYINNSASGVTFTADNVNDSYPGTDLCGAPVKVGEAYGGAFFRCNGSALIVVAAGGFTNVPVLQRGSWTDEEEANYVRDALNYYWTVGSVDQTAFVVGISDIDSSSEHTRLTRYVFAVNAGEASRLAKLADPSATSWQLTVSLGACPDGTVSLKTGGYTDRRDFELDGANVPQWSPFPLSGEVSHMASGGGSVVFDVDMVTFETTVASDDITP